MHGFPATALGGLALIGLSTFAHAQSFPAPHWSGVYLGSSVGNAQGQAKSDAATAIDAAVSYFTPPDPEQIAAVADGTVSQSSLSGGIFAGFGKQYGNLYLGVETSVNSLHFDETRTASATYLSNSDGTFTNALSVKADWQASLRGRVGFVYDRWLAYVTGGAAVTQIRLDASFYDDFLGAGASGRDSGKQTKLGWVAGLGGEYALSQRWMIRGEYLYADYGKVETASTVINPAFPLLANRLENSADFKTQTLSVGMGYRF